MHVYQCTFVSEYAGSRRESISNEFLPALTTSIESSRKDDPRFTAFRISRKYNAAFSTRKRMYAVYTNDLFGYVDINNDLPLNHKVGAIILVSSVDEHARTLN